MTDPVAGESDAGGVSGNHFHGPAAVSLGSGPQNNYFLGPPAPPHPTGKRKRIALAAAGALVLIGGGSALLIRLPMSPDRNPSTPVKIEQVAPLNTDPNESFVAQGSVQLSPSQLAKVDKFDSKGLAALLPAGSAVPTDSGFIGATLMGAATKTVTITGMHILKQCQPPLTGTDFYNPPAGLDPTISLGFDLDSPITYAQVSQGGEYSGNFFQQNTISLAPGETRTLAVYVTTHQHYCRFSFQMTVATTYGTVTENIDNGGKQFQLTAQAEKADQSGADFSHYQAVYVGGVVVHPGEGWTRVNPKTYDETEDPASFPPPTPTGNQP